MLDVVPKQYFYGMIWSIADKITLPRNSFSHVFCVLAVVAVVAVVAVDLQELGIGFADKYDKKALLNLKKRMRRHSIFKYFLNHIVPRKCPNFLYLYTN